MRQAMSFPVGATPSPDDSCGRFPDEPPVAAGRGHCRDERGSGPHPVSRRSPDPSRKRHRRRTRRQQARRPPFDYEALSEPLRQGAKDRAAAIHGRLGWRLKVETGGDVVAVGLRLQIMHESLGRKFFQPWLAAEFEWTQPTAPKFMRSALAFQDLASSDEGCLDRFQPSALYVLAREQVPPAARREAIAAVRRGDFIRKRDADAIVDRHTDGAASTSAHQKACRTVEKTLKRLGAPPTSRAVAATERLMGTLAARLRVWQAQNENATRENTTTDSTVPYDPAEANIPREYLASAFGTY